MNRMPRPPIEQVWTNRQAELMHRLQEWAFLTKGSRSPEYTTLYLTHSRLQAVLYAAEGVKIHHRRAWDDQEQGADGCGEIHQPTHSVPTMRTPPHIRRAAPELASPAPRLRDAEALAATRHFMDAQRTLPKARRRRATGPAHLGASES